MSKPEPTDFGMRNVRNIDGKLVSIRVPRKFPDHDDMRYNSRRYYFYVAGIMQELGYQASSTTRVERWWSWVWTDSPRQPFR